MPVKHFQKYLLYSTPRAGSNPTSEVLGNYLNVLNGQKNYYEYFNRLLIFEELKLIHSDQNICLRKTNEIFFERFQSIKQNPDQYFIKLFPNQGTEDLSLWLQETYEYIFLERQSVWDQLLSFLVSMATKLWYVNGGINLAARSLVADINHFQVFMRLTFTYEETKKLFRDPKVIVFEDFLKRGSSEVLAELGMPMLPIGAYQEKSIRFEKQNVSSKEELFSNIDEIQKWFSGSLLDSLQDLRSAKL